MTSSPSPEHDEPDRGTHTVPEHAYSALQSASDAHVVLHAFPAASHATMFAEQGFDGSNVQVPAPLHTLFFSRPFMHVLSHVVAGPG
jgi:hypothetical protein